LACHHARNEDDIMTETLYAVLPDEVDEAARRVLESACKQDLSLATAESCTGGLLASLLTDVEGASHAFERGFVVYTNEAKADLLGIPIDLIEREGAVSEAVARAMAEGALKASDADIALSITGFAGPGGPDDEPGRVHFGCARDGRATSHREMHFGDVGRGPVRIACMRVALEMIDEALA
jgi:nicotinamide-nucleotide amidase